jgi:hypothetical protein
MLVSLNIASNKPSIKNLHIKEKLGSSALLERRKATLNHDTRRSYKFEKSSENKDNQGTTSRKSMATTTGTYKVRGA